MIVFFRRLWRLSVAFLSLPIPGTYALFLLRKGGWHAVKNVTIGTIFWGKCLAKIFHLNITVHGNPEQISGGLIVSNHMGYIDILTHACTFHLRFAPKIEIRSWPFLGWYLNLSRPVWVDRRNRQKSRQTVMQFRETMNHGLNLLVYPEGTSTSGEQPLLPFKSTPFEAASGEEVTFPILPVLTVYRPFADGGSMAWYGNDAALIPHAWMVLGQKELFVDLYILDPILPEKGESRKDLAARVYKIMNQEYCRIKNIPLPKENLTSAE